MAQAIYNIYLWKCGRLELSAHDIVAGSDKQAAQRAVWALRKRPGLNYDATLMALDHHLIGQGECPSGVQLQVVKTVDGPADGPCIVFG